LTRPNSRDFHLKKKTVEIFFCSQVYAPLCLCKI
jgi:hypothetical protein